jgi:alpha-beta hydrolase superfamily lysophospholipase
MAEQVRFFSDGIRLVGYIYRPEGLRTSEKHSAVLVCHGFGAHQERYLPDIANYLCGQGYIVMTFDYRGFGESEGPRWRLIPLEQIADIRNALTFLQVQDGVDASSVGLYGTSFGGANVVYAAAVDQRVKCVVSVVGVGCGEKWMRSLRRSYEWAEFQRELEEDWKQRVLTGKSRVVDRLELMKTDPATAAEATRILHQFPMSCTHLPLETGQAVIDYHPEDMVARIAPRPVLFIVAGKDVLVPNHITREVYDQAEEPKKWVSIPNCDHYGVYYQPAFSSVMAATHEWYRQYLPAKPGG